MFGTRAVTLGFWGDDDFKDWGGGRGSGFILLRGFESCWDDETNDISGIYWDTCWDDEAKDISGLDWDTGRDCDDETKDISGLVWDGTGAGVGRANRDTG